MRAILFRKAHTHTHTHTHTLISARAIRRKDCRTRKTRGGLQRCKGFHISSLANEVMVTFLDGRH